MAVLSTMASQFTKDGKYFAQLTFEGKLRIWETATSTLEQEYIPDYHLTSPCTCLQFVQTRSNIKSGSPRKKKKRESDLSTAPYITLGTTSGTLLVYSIRKAELEVVIDSKTSETVSCLSWVDDNIVYSGANQHVLLWNLEKKSIESKWKAGNETITAILKVPGRNKILTASRSIKLWDVKRKEVLKVFTGHSYEVVFLQYVNPRVNADAYIISGSKGDRLISCWSLNESTDTNAIASFLMEDVANNATVVTNSNNVTSMAVVTRSGVIHVYQHTLNGKCIKPIKPKTTVRVASDTGQKSTVAPIPIYGAYFQDDLTVLICHGSQLMLTFEPFVINEYEKVQCLIRKEPHALKQQENQVQKIATPLTDNVNYLTPHTSSAQTTKRKAEGKLEIPMEKRLENLTLNKLDGSSKVPKANNVAQLLVQGLHSKDKAILRSVLNKGDETMIQNTVKKLPMPVIIPFVQELSNLIQGKTLSSQIGALWFKHVLQLHAGILLSNPDLPELLGPALGSIENRLTMQMPLNRLRGRLDLIISQASNVNNEEKEIDEALLVYNDKDSSDESEMEAFDTSGHSDSDHEWVEDSSEKEESDEVNEVDDSDEGMSS